MVQVQSSWFPLIDQNPQNFIPNIFAAKDGDFQPAHQQGKIGVKAKSVQAKSVSEQFCGLGKPI